MLREQIDEGGLGREAYGSKGLRGSHKKTTFELMLEGSG
jgi:hypothetical protein